MRRKKPKDIIKKGAPSWMVSFSDLNTLLLTFFILLIVFAREKKHGLEEVGLGSMVRDAFTANGINGIFKGRLSPTRANFSRPLHMVPEQQGKPVSGRQIGDRIALPGSLRLEGGSPAEVRSLPLRRGGSFALREARLGLEARMELSSLAAQLAGKQFTLLVQASAGAEESDAPERLAGRRALAAAAFLARQGVPPGRIVVGGVVDRSGTEASGSGASRSMSITVIR